MAEATKARPRPRVIKTHLPYRLLPKRANCKYIFVTRNPKDVVVSFYHHVTGFKHYDFKNGSFDKFFAMFTAGQMTCGSYFDFHQEYMPMLSTADNCLVVTYESLQANLVSQIIRIAKFVGGKALEVIADRGQISEIARKASFESMASNERLMLPKYIHTRYLIY